MKKRIITPLLTAILLTLVLAGCQNGSDDNNTASSTVVNTVDSLNSTLLNDIVGTEFSDILSSLDYFNKHYLTYKLAGTDKQFIAPIAGAVMGLGTDLDVKSLKSFYDNAKSLAGYYEVDVAAGNIRKTSSSVDGNLISIAYKDSTSTACSIDVTWDADNHIKTPIINDQGTTTDTLTIPSTITLSLNRGGVSIGKVNRTVALNADRSVMTANTCYSSTSFSMNVNRTLTNTSYNMSGTLTKGSKILATMSMTGDGNALLGKTQNLISLMTATKNVKLNFTALGKLSIDVTCQSIAALLPYSKIMSTNYTEATAKAAADSINSLCSSSISIDGTSIGQVRISAMNVGGVWGIAPSMIPADGSEFKFNNIFTLLSVAKMTDEQFQEALKSSDFKKSSVAFYYICYNFMNAIGGSFPMLHYDEATGQYYINTVTRRLS